MGCPCLWKFAKLLWLYYIWLCLEAFDHAKALKADHVMRQQPAMRHTYNEGHPNMIPLYHDTRPPEHLHLIMIKGSQAAEPPTPGRIGS